MDKESLLTIGDARPTVRLARAPTAPPVKAPEAGAGPPQDAPEAAAAASESQLEKTLHELTEHVQNLQRRLEFSVDEDSGETIIRVIDRETKEVIRQIPSAEMLAIERRLRSAAAGVLVAEKI